MDRNPRTAQRHLSRGGYHAQGTAIDLNCTTNPYIATRTGNPFDGEAASAQAVLRPAAEVYDHAVAFTFSETDRSDTSCRVHDSIEDIYDHFQVTSDCLVHYFNAAFSSDSRRVDRPPIPGVADLADCDPAFGLFGDELPGGLAAAETVIATLETQMSTDDWRTAHPSCGRIPRSSSTGNSCGIRVGAHANGVRQPRLTSGPHGTQRAGSSICAARSSGPWCRWAACVGAHATSAPPRAATPMHFDLGR